MDPNRPNRPADPADHQGFGPEAPGLIPSAVDRPDGPGSPRLTGTPPGAPPDPFYGSPYLDPARRKRCPLCAEEVSAAAHICHFCGYSFDDGSTVEQRTAFQNRLNAIEAARLARGGRSCLRMLLPVLFLLLVFLVVGIILLNSIGQLGHLLKTPAPSGPSSSPIPAHTIGPAPASWFEIELD